MSTDPWNFQYQKMYCEENVYRLIAKVKVMQQLQDTGKETLKGWKCLKSFAIFGSSFICDPASQPKRAWPHSQFPIAIKEASRDPSVHSTMMWDYHVFAVFQMQPLHGAEGPESPPPAPTWWVYDFDTKLDGGLAVEGPRPLGKGIPLEYYFHHSFCDWGRAIPKGFTREEIADHCAKGVYFRVVPGEEFLSTFTSDRSHMIDILTPKNKKGEINWMSEPPSWPCISKKPELETNLADFLNMANVYKDGKPTVREFTAPGAVMHRDQVIPFLTAQ
jgi:hypothetical protein